MRADKFFAARFGSRNKAKEMLKAGRISSGGRILAPDDEISEKDEFTVSDGLDFVSQGGKKLERGLSFFGERVEGLVFADLGASTGGFTDCLLRRGAKKVYCVDVGESQLDERLAADPRVVVMDKTNARYLTAERFPEPLDGVAADLSFISLRLVLPAVRDLLVRGGKAFVLFKPQFECGGKGLGKSGILPRARHAELLGAFYDFCIALGLAPRGAVAAPVVPKKNIEYILFLEKDGIAVNRADFLASAENFLENT